MSSIFSSPSIRVNGGPKAESLSPRERAVSHPTMFLSMHDNVTILRLCSYFGQQAERERMVLDIKVKLQVIIALIVVNPTPALKFSIL